MNYDKLNQNELRLAYHAIDVAENYGMYFHGDDDALPDLYAEDVLVRVIQYYIENVGTTEDRPYDDDTFW